jgi:hypothetical protein
MQKALFILASTVALTGCLDSTDPEAERPYGSLALESTPMTGVGASTRPYAYFFRAAPSRVRIPNSRVTSGRCDLANYSASTSTPPLLGDVSAGTALSLSIGGTEVSLPRTGLDSFYYASDGTVFFTPGDSARLSVPGEVGQFPAFNLAVKTADPFQPEEIPDPSSGDDLTVRWTPAGDTSSAMLISLRYATQGNATQNQQIFCDVADDGEAIVDGSLIGGWRQAASGSREAVFTRVRTAEATAEGSLLHIFSSYVVRIPVADPVVPE